MAYFDTHTHLNIEPLLSKSEQIVSECSKENILINVVGIDIETSKVSLLLSKKFSGVYATVGIHPTSINDIEYDDLDNFFESLLKEESEKIIGIGETGLDYHGEKFDAQKQKKYFLKHIEIAKKYNKALVIHVRDAHEDLIKLLRENMNDLRVIIHCFSGGPKEAKMYIDLGCYVSFSGIVSFKNALDVIEASKIIPIDRILIETDCPWLSPHPYRGKENTPLYVKYVYDALAKIRPEKNLREILYENSLTAFSINKKTLD